MREGERERGQGRGKRGRGKVRRESEAGRREKRQKKERRVIHSVSIVACWTGSRLIIEHSIDTGTL